MLKEKAYFIEALSDYHKILNDAILRQQATTYIKVRWERPKIAKKQNFFFLGVEEADPVEYVKRYGSTLVNNASEYLPEITKNFPPPVGKFIKSLIYQLIKATTV